MRLFLCLILLITSGCSIYENQGKKDCDQNCLRLIQAAQGSHLFATPIGSVNCTQLEQGLLNQYLQASQQLETDTINSVYNGYYGSNENESFYALSPPGETGTLCSTETISDDKLKLNQILKETALEFSSR